VKDVWENLRNRTEAQIDLIDEAVVNRDDSFPAKVDFLVEKEAIQPETGDAIKEMFDTRLQETQGINTEELIVQKKEEQVQKIIQLLLDSKKPGNDVQEKHNQAQEILTKAQEKQDVIQEEAKKTDWEALGIPAPVETDISTLFEEPQKEIDKSSIKDSIEPIISNQPVYEN